MEMNTVSPIHDYSDWEQARQTCMVPGCENQRRPIIGRGRPEMKCQHHRDLGYQTPAPSIDAPRPEVSKYNGSHCFLCGDTFDEGDRYWFCGSKSKGGKGGACGWHTRAELLTSPNAYATSHATMAEPIIEPSSEPSSSEPTTSEPIDTSAIERNVKRSVLADVNSTLGETIGEQVEIAIENLRPKQITIQLPSKPEVHLSGLTHKQLPEVLAWVSQGQHVWMVGPAGTGKSRMARSVAEALNLNFGSISVGAQTAMSEIKGFMNANGTYVDSILADIYGNGGLFLVDEADAGHPGVMTALNGLLADEEAPFPHGMVKRHPDFVLLAAANTFGNGADAQYVGRQFQDFALLDRFAFVDIEIDEDIEQSVALGMIADQALGLKWLKAVRQARENVNTYGLKVLVTPRAAMAGCRGLHAGLTWDQVTRSCITKGIKADQVAKVLEGIER